MPRRVGAAESWLYTVLGSGFALTIYAVFLRGDRRATVRPWLAVVDALWAGVVFGTAIWVLIACGHVVIQVGRKSRGRKRSEEGGETKRKHEDRKRPAKTDRQRTGIILNDRPQEH